MLDESVNHELALQHSFYEALIGMVIVSDDGTLYKANEAFCQMVGYREEELRGLHFRDITHPGDLQADEAFFEQMNAGDLSRYRMEKRYVHRSGEIVEAQLHVSAIDQAGKEQQRLYLSQVTDLTQTKLQQERLSEAFHQNQLILSSMGECIFGVAKTGEIIFWNDASARATGFAEEDLRGCNLHDLLHHTNKAGVRVPKEVCALQQSLQTGEPFQSSDDLFWRKDGTSFPVEYRARPIHQNGSYVGMVVTFGDVSERLQQAERMLNSEKLSIAGQMAAGIAHEIRNPLTSLKGFLKLMQAGSSDKGHYMRIMQSELERIEFILNELLLLVKPQVAHFVEQGAQALLQDVLLLLDTQAILHDVQIVTELPEREIVMNCDPNQIKQVFINVLKNGIEAMPGGGVLHIGLTAAGDRAVFTIADQGCGIPEEQLAQIGTPFFTTKQTGTGLGLMVTRQIIDSHLGTMDIQSKVGEGTVFRLSFPCRS